MSNITQLFPPCPKFTEKDIPDQTGKVHIVTGGTSGVGFELAKILYQKNATVYIAARSAEKIDSAISAIRKENESSLGKLQPLLLDLADLSTIKPAAEQFMAQETRLDVLFHNAGVMGTAPEAMSSQGFELQLATNALGPFLLTRLLEPVILRTATSGRASPGSVRIVWVGSMLALGTPQGGVVWDAHTGQPRVHADMMSNYMQSKAGVTFLASEYAARLADHKVISTSLHPGMMKTELQRHMPAPVRGMMGVVFKGPAYGAYTELFAGVSPGVQIRDSGRYIIPWGRFGTVPEHMAPGLKGEHEGGAGTAKKFWDWCEERTEAYR
ncbi:hypothetical protein F4775DRAFT_245498 [Biscogniauxia sp. FL1348]|nr:hypothetical protein F4775DRAFT_245498 [Biscogniauxia sp. FL1348]